MRIGVLGGTFDPIHIAHLVAALEVRDRLHLDEVRFVVANDPWQKADRAVTPAEDRFAMVAAALAGIEGMAADRCELDRGGLTYSVDTLESLVADEPTASLFLIVGADAAAGLQTWRRPERVLELATLVVVNRGGDMPELPAAATAIHVPIPPLDLSSTMLRARVAAGQRLDYLVPPPVLEFIFEHGLYASE